MIGRRFEADLIMTTCQHVPTLWVGMHGKLVAKKLYVSRDIELL